MKKYPLPSRRLLASLLLGGTLLTACDPDKDQTPKDVAYGPSVPMGNGQARSFVRLDASGEPTSLGFTMTREALDNLPDHGGSFVLDLPTEKAKTPYDHLSIDWASHGHEPATIYDKPHFDMHFYLISKEKKAAIVAGEAMQKLPSPELLPPTYIHQPGEGIPQMGKHWGDATAPEFQGKPFTTTFVYGSYDGQVIFHEPMVTRDFLLTRPDTSMVISQPEAFARRGLRYPTHYAIRFDASTNVYTVSFDNLTLR